MSRESNANLNDFPAKIPPNARMMSNDGISGLHHVTAIAGDAQRNVEFYTNVLGLRLVKRTVNFDDPGTYHLYYGDEAGTPGTILTFFPWAGIPKGNRGTGEVAATAYAIPVGAVDPWMDRLARNSVAAELAGERFGETVIRLADPDGMAIELIASESDEAADATAVRGFHSVTGALEGTERTAELLTNVMGYRSIGQERDRFRFATGTGAGIGERLDLVCRPEGHRGRSGAGSVHHVAFRVADDTAQLAWRERLLGQGFNVSPVMDRDYFHSIYFREPGGILFEIATDPPGFTVDEPLADLGRGIKLPAWLEPRRGQIEAALPPLSLP